MQRGSQFGSVQYYPVGRHTPLFTYEPPVKYESSLFYLHRNLKVPSRWHSAFPLFLPPRQSALLQAPTMHSDHPSPASSDESILREITTLICAEKAFENTSTSVAASQMRNALNNLADTVEDPEQKKVRLSN